METSESNSIPTFDKLMWPTLKALKELGGSGSIQEIDTKVAELERFSDTQLGILHKGGPQNEISYRLAWARTYLRKANALLNSERGIWSLTSQGTSMTEKDVSGVPSLVRNSIPHKNVLKRIKSTDEAEINTKLEESDEVWHETVLSVIGAIKPDAFERLCQRLLREAGFTRVEVTGRSGDGGIDGVGVLSLSLVGFQVLFQAKRVKGSVGAPVVRDFRGAMTGRADKGIIITTGYFTPEAKREATRDGAPPIELIDGVQLVELLRKYNLGIHNIQVVKVENEWFENL